MDRLKIFFASSTTLSLLCLSVVLCFAVESVADSVSGHSMTDFQSLPIGILGDTTTPQVQINTTNDHQLFFKAYNDYSDLDGDGIPETTYKHSIDYYGYFDSYKCYTYSIGEKRFEPVSVTTDKYCNAVGSSGDEWSGNFLNWGSMTRIDAIRKILFGGHRRVDTYEDTVLERSFLPPDIHSFAKHYDGSDVAQLTPFTVNSSARTESSGSNITIGTGYKYFTTQSGDWIKKGDYLTLQIDQNNYMQGWVTSFNSTTGYTQVNVKTIAGSGSSTIWEITNHTRTGITLCNVTYSSLTEFSDTVTDPPLIRVAAGNYAFWAAGEVNQCLWEEEDPGVHGMNYNNPEYSEMYAAQDNPLQADVGIGNFDYVARVLACVDLDGDGVVDANDGQENCKEYPYGNYKPIGLLQEFGDDDQLLFGMIAGTYAKSTSGGDMIMPLFRDDGNGSNMCREINLGSDDCIAADLDDATHKPGDGTFKRVFNWVGGPADKQGADGVINSWSIYRIRGYQYGNWTYGSLQGDACGGGINFFGDYPGQCSNWGNPFAEIYLTALRHWVGENAPTAYQALDKLSNTVFDGLNYAPGLWQDPLNEENYCAPLSIINFSSSVISVDTAFAGEKDELDNTSQGIVKDLGSPYSSAELTRQIGEQEGIHDSGTTWFIGETIADGSRVCTPKAIANLGEVRGICPEGPGQQGGFRIAGMAWYAHTNDIRPESALSGHALKGTQTVDTYAVRLSAGNPIIEIPVPGSSDRKVTIIPSCIDNNKDDYGCTLVDFKIIKPHTETNGVGRGKFLAIWEDALQGSDYDLDAGGIIEYEITGTEIQVTTAVTLENLWWAIGHGYVISGTTTDGLHIHSGTNSFDYIDPDGGCIDSAIPCTVDKGCSDCYGLSDGGSDTTVTYTLGGSGAGILEDPLWYAAKWGGFTDLNDNKMPDLVEEWDKKINKTGDKGSDGIPDNYFQASHPRELEEALRRTFNAILERTSSGTAAAVVSSNVRGEGALYQAFYEPLKKDGVKEAGWIGTIQALWLDSAGYTREDCSPLTGYDPALSVDTDGNQICPAIIQRDCSVANGTLDDYCIDQVVATYYDELEKRVRVRVFESNVPGTFEGSGNVFLKEINELSYLWNGREQLYLDNLKNDIPAQQENRMYSFEVASEGRYIMTWIDKDYDGEVDPGEYIDFQSDMFTTGSVPYGFFDVDTEAEAVEVVDYIRGVEIAGTRSRTIKYSADDATEQIMRLGDIINSTPTIVGSPQEAFNLLYKDVSYNAFRQQYQNRRNMVYVGGNDGLLHAFNGGFYNNTNGTVEYSVNGTNCADNTAAMKHELGREIWAYAPMNLLSHLQWLKDPNYAESHVYYVDGKPRVFDANIFLDDTDHPGGWGTVLVVGMNLGGGKMEVDVESDGSAADVTMSSAYIVFDITNPENEPVLLGEIKIPDESFSTVYPAVAAFKDTDTPRCDAGITACNRWYLVFGNGPNDISSYTTDQNGKVYLFDLEQLTTAAGPIPFVSNHPLIDPAALCSVDALTVDEYGVATMNILTCDTGITALFMGTPVVVDWDLDFFSDTVYFGLVGNSDADTGRLIRFAFNNDVEPTLWSVPETLFQTDQPVLVQPVPALDNLHNKWIFFGTGRYFTIDDKTSTATQSLYGIKDDGSPDISLDNSGSVSRADLLDVTNAEVYSDRTVTGLTGIATFDDLVDYVDDTDASNPTGNKGWVLDLPPIVGVAGAVPATRNTSRSTLLGGILFSSVFQPSVDPCEGEGRSRLYGLFYKTGTAYPGPAVFGTTTETDSFGVTKERSLSFFELGSGFAATPSLHSGTDSGEKGVSVFTQLSTGDVVRKTAETVQSVRTGRVSWNDGCQ